MIFLIKKIIIFFGFLTSFINFKYFYNITKLITFFVDRKTLIKIKLNYNSYFTFFLKDPYYNRLVYSKFKYEPEIYFLLKKIKKINFLFLDIGANFGFWSILISSYEFKKKVLALEPMSSNFKILNLNRLLNKKRFIIKKIGAGEKRKKSKMFYENDISNAGASVVRKYNKELFEVIQIETIDNILSKYKNNKIVIKLDIEENEINALKGSVNTLKKDCLVIYEDHGGDSSHRNSKYLKNNNFSIFYINKKKIYEMKDLKKLNKIKKDKNKGYNFVATKSPIFIKYLLN